MMKKIFAFLALAFALAIAPAQKTGAHVLIKDSTGEVGAILHITPDDDPIAGQPSTLFFDMQGSTFGSHEHNVVLQITDDKAHTVDVAANLTGNTISTGYVFPYQGVYTVTLHANATSDSSSAHTHTFTHTLRVARGEAGSALDEPTHAWADIGMIVSVCGLALLGIIANDRIKQIAKYSQWHH